MTFHVEVNFLDPRLPDRFWSKCIPEPNSGCWLWFGALLPDDYGSVFFDRRTRRAHCVAYTSLVGVVPVGLELDHRCRTRSCCNPAHLEPVTKRVNILRGVGLGARNARKTHCPRGHVYDRFPSGKRRCSTCDNAHAARQLQQRRAP